MNGWIDGERNVCRCENPAKKKTLARKEGCPTTTNLTSQEFDEFTTIDALGPRTLFLQVEPFAKHACFVLGVVKDEGHKSARNIQHSWFIVEKILLTILLGLGLATAIPVGTVVGIHLVGVIVQIGTGGRPAVGLGVPLVGRMIRIALVGMIVPLMLDRRSRRSVAHVDGDDVADDEINLKTCIGRTLRKDREVAQRSRRC
eukprot:scaffold15510_cov213-Amphora_coffeaeformis.AAC.5